MHKSTFDEKQLEKLLQNMPKVKDQQDPEQLFAKISSRLEEEKNVEKKNENKKGPRKVKMWILPTLASIAAVVIVALVSPSFLLNQNSKIDHSAQPSIEDKQIESKPQEEENFTMMAEEGQLLRFNTLETHTISTILEEEEIITVAIPDGNAQFVVPVSFVVPKDGSARLEKIETIQNHLHEEEWGLASYVLDGVSFTESIDDNIKKLIINVPENHNYGKGSAMEVIFLSTAKEIARQQGYSAIEFRTAGKLGVTLGNYGDLTELNLLSEDTKGIYFVFQPFGYNQKYLVPFSNDVEFSEAMELMKKPNEMDEQQLMPAIPENIQFNRVSLDEKTKHAVIEFADGTVLTNDETTIVMIEAILMTAKEYGAEQVQFLNGSIEMIGPFNIVEPVSIPLAVNPMPY